MLLRMEGYVGEIPDKMAPIDSPTEPSGPVQLSSDSAANRPIRTA
jgi:hypothetical protein